MVDRLVTLSEDVLEFIRGALAPPGGFMPGEETLTEMVLVALKRSHAATTCIAKPSRFLESREGHDWVWTIRTRFGYGTFRVQAKKLDAGGQYKELNHPKKVGKDLQLERLIRTAKLKRHAPIYALYNGDFGPFAVEPVRLGACCRLDLQRSQPGKTDHSFMGVTVVDAHWIKYLMQPSPPAVPPVPATKDVNGAAMPWECLIVCRGAAMTTPPRTSPDGSPIDDDPEGNGPSTDGGATGDAPPGGSTSPRRGVDASATSYMRQLARALQTGEASAGMTGFSQDPPDWWRRFLESNDVDGTMTDDAFTSLEPDLQEGDGPRYYVFTDLSDDSARGTFLQ